MPRRGLNAGQIRTLPESGFPSSVCFFYNIFHLRDSPSEYLTLEEDTKPRKSPAMPPGCHCSLRLPTLCFSLHLLFTAGTLLKRVTPISGRHKKCIKNDCSVINAQQELTGFQKSAGASSHSHKHSRYAALYMFAFIGTQYNIRSLLLPRSTKENILSYSSLGLCLQFTFSLFFISYIW